MKAAMSLGVLLVVAMLQTVVSAQSPSPKELYQRGLNAFAGGPISRNDMRGVEDIRKAADLGYVPAQFSMGYLIETGAYTLGAASDAMNWYRKASEQGDRLSQWNLGRCYYTGIGFATDLDRAEKWLKESADQGDAFGEYLLGRVQEDRAKYDQAIISYEASARQGLPQAQVRLARMLKQGRGSGGVNKYGAYIWFLVAQIAGDNSVNIEISELEGQLGSTQVEKAKTEAQDLSRVTARAAVAKGCTGWAGEYDAIPQPPPVAIQQFCRRVPEREQASAGCDARFASGLHL